MIDFETYSEAGFVFRDDLGYFKSITRTRHGLPSVGAPAYAEHPSTEILSMAYDLDDGRDVQLWIPGQAEPVDLWDYVRSGRPVSAWNSAFEYYIWRHVAAARLGWPDLPWWQLRDPMARARAWSLPGKLAVCAEVLGEDVAQKDKDGKRLLDKFSKPRKPTKADPRLRLRPEDDPIDGHALYMYNRQDVVAETSVSARLPELSYHESTVWSLDQSINYRGVQIDRDALADCLAIVAQAENRYTDELISLTGGQVTTANQLQKMQAWLAGRGVSLGSLADESIGVALERTDLPGDARRLLEIRKTLSNSSVKKLHAISRRISGDGRLRDLFVYCGADRTGRWSGSGAQPQNLPAMSLPHGTVDDALWVISARSLDTVERVYGDPLDTVSACIRGLFIAAPGHELISSDYSAIEAVCLAALAGEQWRLDVFKGHGLIYETSAAMITGVSLAEQLEHRRTTGKHHPVRRIGKVAELACFAGDTEVLTDSGWKRINTITRRDCLFDGVDFVHHGGVVDKGIRRVIELDGITVTPDHKFYLCKDHWMTSGDLNRSEKSLNRAKNTAASLLSKFSESQPEALKPSFVAAIAELQASQLSATYETEDLSNVISVPNGLRLNRLLNTTDRSWTSQKLGGFVGEYLQLLADVLTQPIGSTNSMEVGGLQCTNLGSKTENCFSTTLPRYPEAATRNSCSTVSTMTSAIGRETFDSLPTKNSRTTSAKPFGLSTKRNECRQLNSMNGSLTNTKDPAPYYAKSRKGKQPTKSSTISSSVKARTYDVVDCGRRSRFMVRCNSGVLLAHNSGYQGSVGAWRKFGATGSDDEILAHVRTWRKTSPNIVKLWYAVERCVRAAIRRPGLQTEFRGLRFVVDSGCLVIRLPSGRCLHYHGVSLSIDDRIVYWGYSAIGGWQQYDTYGGKLVENITQAVARDVIAYAMPEITRSGYPIVLHVHDEIVSEVPIGFGSIEHYETIMSTLPDWCNDWPIKASGGWRGHRYRKS